MSSWSSLLLAPWVGLMFAMAVVSLSWLFFVAVPVVLMLAVLVAGGAIRSSWWRGPVSWPVAGVVVLSFVAITGFGSVLSTCPAVWRLPVAAVAGLVNAWLWVRLVRAVVVRPVTRLRVPVVPVGVAGVFALVIVGTVAGFVLSSHPVTRLVAPAAEAATEWSRRRSRTATTPLMVVTGFNTQWDGVPSQSVHLAVPQRRFSYRGIDDDRPLPYGRDDTHRSLRALVRASCAGRSTRTTATPTNRSRSWPRARARCSPRRTSPATPHAPVRNLVVVSPLVEPGRVVLPARRRARGGASSASSRWRACRGRSAACHR